MRGVRRWRTLKSCCGSVMTPGKSVDEVDELAAPAVLFGAGLVVGAAEGFEAVEPWPCSGAPGAWRTG